MLNRISGVAGHLNAVGKMVENGRDCSEVLIQFSAVKSEIVYVSKLILKDHPDDCIVGTVKENDEEKIRQRKEAIDSLL